MLFFGNQFLNQYRWFYRNPFWNKARKICIFIVNKKWSSFTKMQRLESHRVPVWVDLKRKSAKVLNRLALFK